MPNTPFLQTGQLITTRLRPAAPGKDDLRGVGSKEPLLPCSSNLAIPHHAQDNAFILCLEMKSMWVKTELGDKDECAIRYCDVGISANFPR